MSRYDMETKEFARMLHHIADEVEFNKGEDYLKHIDYCSYGARKEQEHD